VVVLLMYVQQQQQQQRDSSCWQQSGTAVEVVLLWAAVARGCSVCCLGLQWVGGMLLPGPV
jgi:hypothetical protein